MLLNEKEIQIARILSFCENDYDKYIVLLKREYGYNLTKNELSIVLKMSEKTIEKRIKDSTNIPSYFRSSNSEKALYLFPITSVATYLVNTIKVN